MNISGRKRKKARLFRKGSWTTVQINRVLGWPMRISTARMSLQNQPKLYRGLVFPFILISYWLQAAFEKRCHLTQLSFLRIQNSKSPVSEEVFRQQIAATITCCYWKNVRNMEPVWGTFHSLFLALVFSFLLPSSFSVLETSVPIKTIM